MEEINTYATLNPDWMATGEGPMWLDCEPSHPDAITEKDVPGKGPGHPRLALMIAQRWHKLEQEFKRNYPGLAGELGIG